MNRAINILLNVSGLSRKLFLAEKLKDQSNSLNSVRFCNISVRPGDHAPFLETHGISLRLGRSGSMNCDLALTS